ncbi:MAG TPA: hypothetical protein DCP91_07970 [Eggerthellaceae bacterium]|nr:hypothetical protein [Eggerthellaceae bacterium]
MDKALFERIQAMQQASFFRSPVRIARSGRESQDIVNKPLLGAPIASAFERVCRFADPARELARLGIHEVHDICLGIDAVDDERRALERIREWTIEGSINVRYMSGGRC